jgi:cyanophycinase
MKRFLMLSAATVLAVTMTTSVHATTPQTATPERPRGTVIMIGGALSDGNAEIYHEIVAKAGGPRARIGVITAASVPPSLDPAAGTPGAANSVTNGRFYVDILKRYGAGAAQWLPIDLDHPGAADDPRRPHRQPRTGRDPRAVRPGCPRRRDQRRRPDPGGPRHGHRRSELPGAA